MKRPIAILALLLLAGSRAQAGDHFSEETKGLPACRQKAAAIPTSWERKRLGGDFSFAMPSDCQPVWSGKETRTFMAARAGNAGT